MDDGDAMEPRGAAYNCVDWRAQWLPAAMHSRCFRGGDYLFGCRWSPDATCVLACSGGACLRVFEAQNWGAFASSSAEAPDAGDAAVTCRAAETVFDYCWFPAMSSAMPESCCFATTARDQPLQLWDAYTGGRFASYAGYADSEELDTATSVAFSCDCSRIFGGYEGLIRVWDVAVPGRSCRKVQLFRRAHSVSSGQKGLVSSIDSSSHGVAVGSFAGTVAVYDENLGGGIILGFHSGSGGNGHGNPCVGVTQVKWSTRCSQIISAGRKDDALSVWDVRMGVNQPLMSLPRHSSTNQRVLFDISSCGRYVITPNHSDSEDVAHSVRVFDLLTGQLQTEVALPIGAFPNAVALHPLAPMFAVATGQRLYKLPSCSSSEDEDETPCKCDNSKLEAALLIFRGSFG